MPDDEQELTHLREILGVWARQEAQRGYRGHLGEWLAGSDIGDAWHDERRRYDEGARVAAT